MLMHAANCAHEQGYNLLFCILAVLRDVIRAQRGDAQTGKYI